MYSDYSEYFFRGGRRRNLQRTQSAKSSAAAPCAVCKLGADFRRASRGSGASVLDRLHSAACTAFTSAGSAPSTPTGGGGSGGLGGRSPCAFSRVATPAPAPLPPPPPTAVQPAAQVLSPTTAASEASVVVGALASICR